MKNKPIQRKDSEMRKQFILDEEEYLSVGNSLEQLDVEIGSLYKKLSCKNDDDIKRQLAIMSKNIRKLLYDIEWID